MKYKFGLDFGSSFTSIYKKGEGIICKEPTLVGVQEQDSAFNIVAIGKECFGRKISKMENTISFSPIEEGKIKSVDYAVEYLKTILKRHLKKNEFMDFAWIVSVPCGLTEKEKNKFKRVLELCHITEYQLVPSVLCLCIGANLDTDGNNYIFVADIGGSSTDIAVVHNFDIVKGVSVGFGGTTIDKAVVSFIKEKYHIQLEEEVAKQIKEDIASLHSSDMACKVTKGLSMVNDKLVNITVYAKDICTCINLVFNEISNVIKATINECDEETQNIILDDTLYITGASSKFFGTEDFFANSVGLTTKVVEKSDNAVVLGLGKLLGR